MLRILIADDERMICEWLEFCIKENPEYEIVGIANNGEQALNLYKKLSPDLVLSDIKMPVMDGLELLKEIKKIDSNAAFVLLTAFSEFEFVREAMREKATEYILKTEINSQSFKEMLNRISNQIKEQRGKAEEDSTYAGQKHSFLHNVFVSEVPITESDLQKLGAYNIQWHGVGLFALAIWRKFQSDNVSVSKHQHIENVIGADYDEKIYVLVGNLSKELSDSQKISVLQEYANKIRNDNDCMVGLSNISNKLTDINKTVEEAVSTLSLGFYKGQIRVYHPLNVNLGADTGKESLKREFDRYYQEFYVKTGEEQYNFLDSILDYIEENKVRNVKRVKTFCKECLNVIFLRYVNDSAELHEEIQAQKNIVEANSFTEMKSFVLQYARDNIWEEGFDENKLSPSIRKAVIFIRQHYGEALSLEQIASEVKLNSEYLSRAFKEETGITYSSYLSNIRMKKAESLLVNTTEKVQAIGERVGYANVSYFSTIFKKRYGMNPYEYRRNNANKYAEYVKKVF